MYYAKDGLKTVAEVEKITGLKRRQLYSYRGIIEPADTLKSSSYMPGNGKFCEGYKMYDDKGIMKLQQIAIFIKLGMKKSEIIEKMKEAGDNALSLLGEQEKLIKEKIKELNQSLAVIDQLKLMGMESPITEVLAVEDLKKYGKRVLDVYSSEYKQQMVKIAETELDKH